MTPLSNDERRALGLLAALLLLAGAARWLERPRSILDDVPDVDVAALEDASRSAQTDRAGTARPRPTRAPAAPTATARSASDRPRPDREAPAIAEPARAAEPFDLNTASAHQLESISGVGPALAGRLIARRDSLGRFRSFDDVDSVRGVGPALLARIRAATVLR